MAYYIMKIVVTTGLVVAVSELSKRSVTLSALLASLPLVSFLSITWLYVETGNTAKVADLAQSIFWLVLPSLPFFLLLPYLLRRGLNSYTILGAATATLLALYSTLALWLARSGERPARAADGTMTC